MKSMCHQQGLAMVEATIVLPLLLFLILAVAEFGRVFYSYNDLTKATQAGARYLSSHTGDTGVLTDTANLIVYGYVAPDDTSDALLPNLSVDDISVDPVGGLMQVQASYQYIPMIGPELYLGFGTAIYLTFTLSTSVLMRPLE